MNFELKEKHEMGVVTLIGFKESATKV